MLSMKTALGENPALSYRNMRAIIGYVGLTLPVMLLLQGPRPGGRVLAWAKRQASHHWPRYARQPAQTPHMRHHATG